MALHVCLQPRQNLWPALMYAYALARQAGMRQADGRGTVLFFQIDAHEALDRSIVPIGKPREDEQARTLDGPILADYAEGLPA